MLLIRSGARATWEGFNILNTPGQPRDLAGSGGQASSCCVWQGHLGTDADGTEGAEIIEGCLGC